MAKWIAVAIVVMVMTATVSFQVSAQQNQMSFFVTSAGSGNGANLGGLAGADKICQTLATAAGAGSKTCDDQRELGSSAEGRHEVARLLAHSRSRGESPYSYILVWSLE